MWKPELFLMETSPTSRRTPLGPARVFGIYELVNGTASRPAFLLVCGRFIRRTAAAAAGPAIFLRAKLTSHKPAWNQTLEEIPPPQTVALETVHVRNQPMREAGGVGQRWPAAVFISFPIKRL